MKDILEKLAKAETEADIQKLDEELLIDWNMLKKDMITSQDPSVLALCYGIKNKGWSSVFGIAYKIGSDPSLGKILAKNDENKKSVISAICLCFDEQAKVHHDNLFVHGKAKTTSTDISNATYLLLKIRRLLGERSLLGCGFHVAQKKLLDAVSDPEALFRTFEPKDFSRLEKLATGELREKIASEKWRQKCTKNIIPSIVLFVNKDLDVDQKNALLQKIKKFSSREKEIFRGVLNKHSHEFYFTGMPKMKDLLGADFFEKTNFNTEKLGTFIITSEMDVVNALECFSLQSQQRMFSLLLEAYFFREIKPHPGSPIDPKEHDKRLTVSKSLSCVFEKGVIPDDPNTSEDLDFSLMSENFSLKIFSEMVLSRGNKTTPFKAFSLNKKTWKDWGDNDYLPPKWKRCLNTVSCLSGDLPLWPTIPCEEIFVSDKYIQNFERTYKTAAAEAYQKIASLNQKTLLKEGLGIAHHQGHTVSPKKKKF